MTSRRVRFSITAVDDVQELEVVQLTTEGVGDGRARPSNDEVDGASAAWETLTADIELARAADRLGVDDGRQRRQEDNGG